MWTDIESNPTYRAIQRVRQLATLVITGKKQLQMFCSIAGLGKTETVLEVLAEHNMEPHYSSPTGAEAFCQDLWQHRDTSYLLDDCDFLARSEPCANIAKMAYGPQRTVVVPTSLKIQNNEERRLVGDDRYNPNIPPPSFRLGDRHGMVWNSNKNFTDPTVVGKEMAADFRALVSRSLDPFWISSHPQSLFDYTIWMIMTGMLRRHRQGGRPDEGGFKLAHQQEVLQFFCQHAQRLPELTPRFAWKLAMARRHDPDYQMAWRSYLHDTTINRVIVPDPVPRLLSAAMKRAEELTLPEPPSLSPHQPRTAETPKKDGDVVVDFPQIGEKSFADRQNDRLIEKLREKQAQGRTDESPGDRRNAVGLLPREGRELLRAITRRIRHSLRRQLIEMGYRGPALDTMLAVLRNSNPRPGKAGMTSADALQFFRHAFMHRYDEDDDATYESRVVHNDPFYHPDVPGWCYRPADDAVEPRPDWNGGDAAWREGYPKGDQLDQ